MNDFSFAPTNGMEATFCRNRFIANRVEGSTHGLWDGYSWGSEIVGNSFTGNRVGIAIEHGQDNRIAGNRFEGDSTAIRLWWNRLEPSDWGYPKHRDTRSRGYRIEGNAFAGNRVAVRADSTLELSLSPNSLDGVATAYLHNGGSSMAMPPQTTVKTIPGTRSPIRAAPTSWNDSLLARPAVFSDTLPRLDWMWYRPQVPGIPLERWALRAESAVTLPVGDFVLRTISDDAVRVWVDGRLVIDRWTPHESVVDEAPLRGGRHAVRVEYLQVDGWTELGVDFARR